MAPKSSDPDLLTEFEAAKYICMSVGYLRSDRTRGSVGNRTPGPSYHKNGRWVRYRREDLDAWLAANRVERKPRTPGRGRSVVEQQAP